MAAHEPAHDAAALRIAIVGPSHPHKGGVAAHTTTLAHELADAGHDVTLISWSHLYPSLLYPGEAAVPGGAPDVEPFPRTLRVLSWARPDTWLRAGRRLRDMDAIVIVHVIPPVVPAHLALLRAAGVGRRVGANGGLDSAPRTIAITHNVLPHEPRPGDRALMESFLSRVDSVIVHSDEQARMAADLGAHHVRELDLPPHLPGGPRVPHVDSDGPTRLLALGIVRDYKGVDLLLEAVREVPDLRVTVAGEMWGDAGRRVKELALEQGLRDRVEVHGGYVPADRIAELMARHDVLALTYRSATASQNVLLARRHGLPVLATDVGTFGEQVLDGVDGLLVPVGDHPKLVDALRHLSDRRYAAKLRSSVRPPDEAGPWAHYVGALEALASVESSALDLGASRATGRGEASVGQGSGPKLRGVLERVPSGAMNVRRVVTGGGLATLRRGGPRVELRPTDFPDWIRPTDVLARDSDALDAREWAKEAGLPRANDAVAAWAALGALAAIVRICDDGRRRSVIVDESGAKSPLSRWARALGFAPVELELTGPRSSVEVLDVDTASLDVMARLHPGGCSAADVDHAVGQASWALRSGGLRLLTLPVGDDDPAWAIRPADIRGVLARAADLGLILVGDLDGELTERMRYAARQAASSGADATAYGILRLTFRRR